MIQPPAMTPQEIAECSLAAPPVRVSCYMHRCTLYVGDELPPGGAHAVAEAAGCPNWDQRDLTAFTDCPVPDEIAELEGQLATPDGPTQAPGS